MPLLLSPHFDDAVFSCGGLIYDRARLGERAEIWTLCAGDPPPGPLSAYAQSLHERWGLGRDAVSQRREEDREACARVGARSRTLDLPDCIYRRHPETGEFLYEGDDEIFGALAEVEKERLAPGLAAGWSQEIPGGAEIWCPLSLGNHVDHQLTRQAAEGLGRPLIYYADAPYVFAWEAMIPELLPAGAVARVFPVSPDGFRAWMAGNAAYGSQISTFWGGEEAMEAVFRAYVAKFGGLRLWSSGFEPLPGVEPGSRT